MKQANPYKSLEELTPDELKNWHTWSCGCQSRIGTTESEIIYCSEECIVYQALIEGREVVHE